MCLPCSPTSPEQPIYPYGLSISLGDDEITKLDLNTDCEVGDMLHMHCLAAVTSVSKNQTTSGTRTRIELQIRYISAESEDAENEEIEEAETALPQRRIRSDRFYKK